MDFITLSLAVIKALAELGVKTEMVQTEIFPLTEINAATENKYGYYGARGIATNLFEIGKTYTVMLDGVKYGKLPCVAFNTGMGFGNAALSGGAENSGEPVHMMQASNGTVMAVCETQGTHSLAIYEETETIHPIDPKFLPAVEVHLSDLGLPEGTTDADFFSGEGMPLYETEKHRQIMEKLMEACENGTPVIIHGFPTTVDLSDGISVDGMTAIYKLERTCVRSGNADTGAYQFAGFALIGSTFYIVTLTLTMGLLIAYRTAVA